MKSLLSPLRIALLSVFALAAAPAVQAQINVNITPPSWGPAAPASAQYYYVPEIKGYYDLRAQQYVVQREGRWQRVAQLSGYNPNSWHPVVVDYVGDQPWSRHDEYRRRYPASLPPGQRKRLENGKGLPPGQAKKYYGNRDGNRDDRRDDRYNDNDRRRYEDRRGYDDRDDHGKKDKGYKNKGKGKD